MVVGVGAASAGPDAAGPVSGGSWEGAVGEGVEGEAATFEDGVAGVGLDGWPNGVGTVVDKGKNEAWLSGCREDAEGKEERQ